EPGLARPGRGLHLDLEVAPPAELGELLGAERLRAPVHLLPSGAPAEVEEAPERVLVFALEDRDPHRAVVRPRERAGGAEVEPELAPLHVRTRAVGREPGILEAPLHRLAALHREIGEHHAAAHDERAQLLPRVAIAEAGVALREEVARGRQILGARRRRERAARQEEREETRRAHGRAPVAVVLSYEPLRRR